jgi:hypothetical protein
MAPPEQPSDGKEMHLSPSIVPGNSLAVTSAPVKVMLRVVLYVSNPAALRGQRRDMLHNRVEPLSVDLISTGHSLLDHSHPHHSSPNHSNLDLTSMEVLCTELLHPEPPATCSWDHWPPPSAR